MACIAFICMELAICAIHLKYHEPCVKEVVHETKITLQCDSYEVTSAHLLNIILLAFCTLYAFKIRHLPDNFNEAKFIAFSCYATVITWSAFLLIYHESSVKVCRKFQQKKNLALLSSNCSISIFKTGSFFEPGTHNEFFNHSDVLIRS